MTAIEDTKTEAAVVARLAQDAVEHEALQPGEIYALKDGYGGYQVVSTDEYDAAPRRATATRTVTDAASFVAYVNRHKLDGTEIYAHTNSSTVVAVIDSHESSEDDASLPGWQKHKLTLDLEKSKGWLAWEGIDGKYLRQADFADFLDERYNDVIDPAPASMIDLATTFQAKTNVDFDSGIRMDSGEVQLSYKETVTAKAGQKGNIVIPKKVKLALRPYVGGPIYFIWAHFRYRLTGSDVLLGFKLERPEQILDAAFADIVTEIRDGRTDKKDGAETRVHDGVGDVPIFNGKP